MFQTVEINKSRLVGHGQDPPFMKYSSPPHVVFEGASMEFVDIIAKNLDFW